MDPVDFNALADRQKWTWTVDHDHHIVITNTVGETKRYRMRVVHQGMDLYCFSIKGRQYNVHCFL